MSIKDCMLKQKGRWILTKKDNWKIIIDLDKEVWDDLKWYKKTGTMDNVIENLDELIKGVYDIKKV